MLSIAGSIPVYSIFAAEYVRDELGRIIEKRENLDRESYVYDNAGRLVRVERNGHATTFGYDANGNRTHENDQEVTTYDSHDRMLRYRDAQYAYTPSGELLSKTRGDALTRYTYDTLGNLVAVRMPDDTEITYLIDGANRRIGKKVDGVLVQGFLYQDVPLLAITRFKMLFIPILSPSLTGLDQAILVMAKSGFCAAMEEPGWTFDGEG